MRKRAVLCLLLVTGCQAPTQAPKLPVVHAALCPARPADNDLALLTARSTVIVSGALKISATQLRSYDKADDSIEVPLDDVKVLKGHVGVPVTVDILRYHGEGPSQSDLEAATDKDRVFFLEPVEINDKTFVMADMRPMTSSGGADTADAIRREVKRQTDLLAAWKSDTQAPYYAQVRDLIAQLVAVQASTPNAPEVQEAILVKIEGLGPAAIPAIVAQLDDRRPYISKDVGVWSDNPKAWEIEHAQVEKIVDALSVVLWKITNESYSPAPGPFNIETDSDRDAVVAGWRVYASGLSCGVAWKTDSPWGSQAKKRPAGSPWV